MSSIQSFQDLLSSDLSSQFFKSNLLFLHFPQNKCFYFYGEYNLRVRRILKNIFLPISLIADSHISSQPGVLCLYSISSIRMKASLWGFRLVFVCVCVNVSYQNLETNLYSVTRNQCPSLEEKTQIHCIKQTTKFFTSKQPFHSTPGRRRLQVLDARASSCSDPVCSVGG